MSPSYWTVGNNEPTELCHICNDTRWVAVISLSTPSSLLHSSWWHCPTVSHRQPGAGGSQRVGLSSNQQCFFSSWNSKREKPGLVLLGLILNCWHSVVAASQNNFCSEFTCELGSAPSSRAVLVVCLPTANCIFIFSFIINFVVNKLPPTTGWYYFCVEICVRSGSRIQI